MHGWGKCGTRKTVTPGGAVRMGFGKLNIFYTPPYFLNGTALRTLNKSTKYLKTMASQCQSMGVSVNICTSEWRQTHVKSTILSLQSENVYVSSF